MLYNILGPGFSVDWSVRGKKRVFGLSTLKMLRSTHAQSVLVSKYTIFDNQLAMTCVKTGFDN